MVKTIMNDNALPKIISILNYVVIALLLALSIILFRQNGRLKEELARELIAETNTTTKIDTIWRTVHHTDTVPKIIKKEKELIRIDTIRVPSADSTSGGGSGVIPLQLVGQTYRGEHKDSATNSKVSWEADVEGYSLGDDGYPRLRRMDMTMDIPQPHTTTTVTNTITKKKRLNFQIGVGVGYGLATKKPDIYTGVSVGYSIY